MTPTGSAIALTGGVVRRINISMSASGLYCIFIMVLSGAIVSVTVTVLFVIGKFLFQGRSLLLQRQSLPF
jgi:hypothetical protein